MDILYLLIPLSAVAMVGVLAVFAWALHGGQFEDVESAGQRALFDSDQSVDRNGLEQSPPCH